MKLIDAVVPAADLVKAAKDWIKAGGKAVKPWDEKGFKLPGGPVYSKAGMMTFPAANAIYRRETYDNYPAARAILQVVYEGLQVDMDTALRVESRWFAKIVRSPEAAAMIRTLFVSMQDLEQGRAAAGQGAGVEHQENRRHRRRLHGRRHRASERRRRPAGGADRPRSGDRRQRQGGAAQGAVSDRVTKGRMKSAARDELLSPSSRRAPTTARSRIATWSSKPCSRTARSRPTSSPRCRR